MTNNANFVAPDPLRLLRPYNPKSPANLSRGAQQAGWVLNLYPEAGEPLGAFDLLQSPAQDRSAQSVLWKIMKSTVSGRRGSERRKTRPDRGRRQVDEREE